MIRFNSDYTEGCHTAILEKLVETNMEQTAGYGEDEYCGQARELIRKAGKTMIIVTHDLSEAISLADKVYVLSARPATIKAVLPIRLTLPDASPLAARNAPEFPYYFKQLWEELTDETTN